MALLSVSNLSKAFGTDIIFQNVSFEIQENDRIGLVGVNGSGKTTLLKLLTREMNPDSGDIYQANHTTLGYMEQHVCRDLERSAYSEVMTVFSYLLKIEEELEYISQQLQADSQNSLELINRQSELNDIFVREGGLTCRARARSALLGLGFDDEQMALPIGVLSGGQRAKLQLAKMLLCGANLLLLDEPTNHLDITSVEWLEDFLRSYNGAFVVISHDRYFLDRVTSRTFEMDNHCLTVYKGNYTTYLSLRKELRAAAQKKYDLTQKEISRIEGIVAQQRQWNREKNIKTAESKLKVIERLQSTLEKPSSDPESIRFHFSASQRSGNDVLAVEDLSLSFDGKLLFQHVNLELHRGERVFLIGPNGCGKTSLLKTLLSQYHPDSGEITFGTGVDVGYYDQIQGDLEENKTVLDEIWDRHPNMTRTEIQNALAVFLFRGEDVFKPVSGLSGGERARLLLLRLMLSKANFLLLDEPTNHLDIASSEALENALQNYEGTLLIVSHDRYLINKIADRLYYLDSNGTVPYAGNYDYYLEKSRVLTGQVEKQSSPKINDYRKRKEQESEKRKIHSAMERTEREIECLEQESTELEERLQSPEVSSDYEAALEITEKISALKEHADQLYEKWSELSERLEKLKEDQPS